MSLTNEELREVTAMLMRAADKYGAEVTAAPADQTCSMTCKGSFTAHHDFTRWECGKCGAYAFAPKKVFAPRYCPHCGAMVVSYDE